MDEVEQFELEMTLSPDMKAKAIRRAEVKVPGDISQEEFWNLVMLLGTSVFGETTGSPEKFSSSWNIKGSFAQWVEESQWTTTGESKIQGESEDDIH
jgi:hypothetical protein